jgi:hypothetical protein
LKVSVQETSFTSLLLAFKNTLEPAKLNSKNPFKKPLKEPVSSLMVFLFGNLSMVVGSKFDGHIPFFIIFLGKFNFRFYKNFSHETVMI